MHDRKQYIRDVRRHLKCSRKSRKKSLENLLRAMDELPPEANGTYEEYVARLGRPETVAAEYLSVMTPKELRHFGGKSKAILGLSIALALIISLFLLVYSLIVKEPTGIIEETGFPSGTASC